MKIILSLISFLLFISCNTSPSIESKTNNVSGYGDLKNPTLTAKLDNNNSISIYRKNAEKPILIQNASMNHRPYLHPIISESLGIPLELWNIQSDLVQDIPDGLMDLVVTGKIDPSSHSASPNMVIAL